MLWLTKLVARFGLARVIGAGVVLLAVLWFGGLFGWAKVKAWYYENKVERVTAQRDAARAEVKVARKDEKQTERAGEITADTVAAQDKNAAELRAASQKSSEVINEVIASRPVIVRIPDDPIVRAEIREAYQRAQAAEDRLRGASSD